MSFWGDVGSIANPVNWVNGKNVGYLTDTGQYDPTNGARTSLTGNAGQANQLGQMGAGNYGAATYQLGQANNFLNGQMQGQNSVSAEQLRQGLQQNLAAQQSQAAGASPQNAAMAARNAAQNMASLGYGMSGQAATAGLQERQNAAQQLSQNYLGMGNQAVAAATGGYGAANQGYGSAIQNPQKTPASALLSAASAAGSMGMQGGGAGAAGGAAAMSDRRVKHDIEDGDADARKLREGLKAYSYKYNNPEHGEGKRIGIMAQDLEAAGSKSVFKTREGKAVNGAVLSTENTAMIVELGKRLGKLEHSSKGAR